jgi:hypothetical protein
MSSSQRSAGPEGPRESHGLDPRDPAAKAVPRAIPHDPHAARDGHPGTEAQLLQRRKLGDGAIGGVS